MLRWSTEWIGETHHAVDFWCDCDPARKFGSVVVAGRLPNLQFRMKINKNLHFLVHHGVVGVIAGRTCIDRSAGVGHGTVVEADVAAVALCVDVERIESETFCESWKIEIKTG